MRNEFSVLTNSLKLSSFEISSCSDCLSRNREKINNEIDNTVTSTKQYPTNLFVLMLLALLADKFEMNINLMIFINIKYEAQKMTNVDTVGNLKVEYFLTFHRQAKRTYR